MKPNGADQVDLMGQQSILRLLIRFSVPAVFGMMVQAFYNIIDRIYIGRAVGSLGIGATTITKPIMMIGFAFALMVGIGGNALISIRLGEQKKDKADCSFSVFCTATVKRRLAGPYLFRNRLILKCEELKRAYFPLKAGLRFSRKAVKDSTQSSLVSSSMFL